MDDCGPDVKHVSICFSKSNFVGCHIIVPGATFAFPRSVYPAFVADRREIGDPTPGHNACTDILPQNNYRFEYRTERARCS